MREGNVMKQLDVDESLPALSIKDTCLEFVKFFVIETQVSNAGSILISVRSGRNFL